jgi:hypothetical protein
MGQSYSDHAAKLCQCNNDFTHTYNFMSRTDSCLFPGPGCSGWKYIPRSHYTRSSGIKTLVPGVLNFTGITSSAGNVSRHGT